MATPLLLIPTLFEAAFLEACPDAKDLAKGAVPWRGFDLAICGMGPVDAGVGAAFALAAGGHDRCLLAGLAGAYAGRLDPTPGLVLVREAILEDLGVRTGQGCELLAGLDPREAIAGMASGIREVTSLTVSSCSGDLRVAQERIAERPKVGIEEMETFAVARACRRAQVPLTCVRAISNEAGDRDKDRWHVPEAMALIQDYLDSVSPRA